MQGLNRLILGTLMLGTLLIGSSATAGAISNVGPDPADFGGLPGDVYGYALVNDPQAQILSIDVPLYYPNNTSNKVVTIIEPDLCWSTGVTKFHTAPGGGNYRDFDVSGTIAYGERTTVYSAPGATSVYGLKSGSTTCYQNRKVLTIPAGSLQLDATTGFYKVVLTASVWGTKTQQNRFRLSIDPGAYVGYSSSAAADSYGVARQYPYSGYRRYAMPFAPPCSVSSAQTNRTIRIYDDDNGNRVVQGPNPFVIRVAEYNAAGTLLRYVPFTSQAATMTVINPTTLRPNSGNSATTWARFTALPYLKYRLIVESVYYVNVLQFQLPYDSINSVITCKEWEATSASSVSTTIAQPGEAVTYTHTVTNNGPETASIAWDVNQTSPSASGVASGGASVYANDQLKTVNTNTFTIPNGTAAGTKYCQQVGINPDNSTDTDTTYKYSGAACVTVANKPRLTVVGGDAASGGSFDCDGTVGGFVGAGNLPGSFGEYALLVAPGTISSFSSAGRVTAPQSRALSFANSPANQPMGNYNTTRCVAHLEPKLISGVTFANYAGGSMPAAGAYRANGSISINAAVLNANSGRRLIVVNGDVTITGNVTYAAGPYARFANVPSLVLIANNIRFAAGVTQVDGLYIARNNVTTCSEAGVNKAEARTNIAQLGVGGVCRTNRIVVNGAIIANGELVPTRSFGGDSPNTLPAELLRFRPEVYLTPIEQGTSDTILKTDSETELPPRN